MDQSHFRAGAGRGSALPPSMAELKYIGRGRGMPTVSQAPSFVAIGRGMAPVSQQPSFAAIGRGKFSTLGNVGSESSVGPCGGDGVSVPSGSAEAAAASTSSTASTHAQLETGSPNLEAAPKKEYLDLCELYRLAEREKWRDAPLMKKDFYREHPEIARMTEEAAAEYRASRNNISVVDVGGDRRPMKPIKSFEHAFQDYPDILQQMRRQGFKEPTPIQAQVWPLALSGYDVIGIAQTGTGKTLAFLLPIFIHLDNQPLPRKDRNGPGCVILSPTRELAMQIHSEVEKYDYKGIKSVCIYGGTSRREQVNICAAGVDIVIATPGRLNDLVRTNVIRLKTVTFLVLDEADRMLDLGFEPQIKKVLCDVRPDRHTIMTSATWPSIVRELAQRYTKNPFMVFVGSLDLSAVHTVKQEVHIVDEDDKMKILMAFLENLKAKGKEKVIIFVGRKNLADHLSSELIIKGHNCESLHGDRDQGDREQALACIKNGHVSILVATDLASRGLDIEDITHVFNYDFPRNIEEYVHRVGRTGRAGRTGTSITLITKSDWRHSTELVKILEEAEQDVPQGLREMSQRFERKKLEHGGTFRPTRYQNGGDFGFSGRFCPSASRKKFG